MSESPRAVFLSYAREDADAARRIADALRAFGVEVWFDQAELRGGDVWDAKIKKQIRECALFMPVISGKTQARTEGYFRREWKLAVERTHDMAAGRAFIVPVVTDDTAEAEAAVPEEFMRVQWTRLPHGVPSPQFVEQVRHLLDAPLKGAGSPTPRAVSAHTAPTGRAPRKASPVPLVATVIVAAVAVGAAIYFARRAPAPPAAPVAGTTPATAMPVKPSVAAVDGKSIAVLPLANMSEDKDTGFFADGVHEDLLTNLALVPELKVVSRTSVMQYRGTTKTIRQIGEELGVAYVLEGSVRRAGNRVRVTGQLINTRTDEHVWAKAYDKDLTDIFAIQSVLAQEIAGALSAAISPQTQKLLARRPTENLVAYDLYLRGRESRNRSRVGAAGLAEAEKLFQGAVEQDAKFAAAWGELAVVHALNVFWGSDASAERLARGDAAIAKAAALAPEAPDVVRTIGTYAYYARRDYARATAQYTKLAQLQPNDPTVFSSLGLIQRREGRWAESLVNLRRATELDPANLSYLRSVLASVQHGRRWDDVRAVHQRLVALLPGDLYEQCAQADDEYAATGSLQAADALLGRLTPAERETPVVRYWRKSWAGDRDDYAEFKRLDQLQPTFEAEEPALSAVLAGTTYQMHGDATLARARIAEAMADWQARAVREPANFKVWLYLSSFEAVLGHGEESVRLGHKAMEALPESRDALDGPNARLGLAWVYAMADRPDEALAELRHLLGVPSYGCPAQLRAMPAFAKLRNDPRFEALLREPKFNQPLF
jgi:TolB-like protein